MILVARRFGFSMWLMIWEAASLPSWPAPMSIDVNCGEVSLANKELLKEMIDRSSGIARWFSRQTLSKETARISSLTRIAVGRSFCIRSPRMASSLFLKVTPYKFIPDEPGAGGLQAQAGNRLCDRQRTSGSCRNQGRQSGGVQADKDIQPLLFRQAGYHYQYR